MVLFKVCTSFVRLEVFCCFLCELPSKIAILTDDLEGRLATENLAVSTTGVAHVMLEASGLRPLLAWP